MTISATPNTFLVPWSMSTPAAGPQLPVGPQMANPFAVGGMGSPVVAPGFGGILDGTRGVRSVYQRGSNSVVRAVKAALRELGLYHGDVSGPYDAALRTSILAFQGRTGLRKTGTPNKPTRIALKNAVARKHAAARVSARRAAAAPSPMPIQSGYAAGPAIRSGYAVGPAIQSVAQQDTLPLGYLNPYGAANPYLNPYGTANPYAFGMSSPYPSLGAPGAFGAMAPYGMTAPWSSPMPNRPQASITNQSGIAPTAGSAANQHVDNRNSDARSNAWLGGTTYAQYPWAEQAPPSPAK